MSEKDYVWKPSSCTYKIEKNFKSVIGDSVVKYDEIIEVAKLFQQKPFQQILAKIS